MSILEQVIVSVLGTGVGRSVLGQVRSECQVRECMSWTGEGESVLEQVRERVVSILEQVIESAWDRCGKECPGTGEGSVSVR